MTAPTPPPLDYAPAAPPWRRRKLVFRAAVVVILLTSAGFAYHYRYRLLFAWRRAAFASARYSCFHDSRPPDTVVYEEDPAAARQLIDRRGYAPLASGAAGRPLEHLDALLTAMDDLRQYKVPLNITMTPGAVVFMHERRNPAGQRLLVIATYALEDPSITTGGSLNVYLFDVDSMTGLFQSYACQYTGGLGGIQDLSFFPRGETALAFSHPKTNKLRIFAGQPDPVDPTRFTFDYEIAGRRGRAAVRILNPDPTSKVPTWSDIKYEPVSLTPPNTPGAPR